MLTARALAEAMEISERTIYRDIADFIGSGAPIDGEAAEQAMARIEAVLPRALEERIAGSEMRFCAPAFMQPAPCANR